MEISALSSSSLMVGDRVVAIRNGSRVRSAESATRGNYNYHVGERGVVTGTLGADIISVQFSTRVVEFCARRNFEGSGSSTYGMSMGHSPCSGSADTKVWGDRSDY
jgi:hypothetical protein